MITELEKEVDRIAAAIVDYVERANGPVTLCEIDREIPGFATDLPAAWGCQRELNGRLAVYWTGMTQAGAAALNKVMFGRKLAVQPTTILPYLLERALIRDDNWQPVLLLPARAANLSTPQALFRLPTEFLERAKIKRVWRQLTPAPMSAVVGGYAV